MVYMKLFDATDQACGRLESGFYDGRSFHSYKAGNRTV
jgi:hypothetical protein